MVYQKVSNQHQSPFSHGQVTTEKKVTNLVSSHMLFLSPALACEWNPQFLSGLALPTK
jgi:hypothetical protein